MSHCEHSGARLDESPAETRRHDVAHDLVRYARHLNSCNTQKHPAEPCPRECSCGLASLLAEAAR